MTRDELIEARAVLVRSRKMWTPVIWLGVWPIGLAFLAAVLDSRTIVFNAPVALLCALGVANIVRRVLESEACIEIADWLLADDTV